MSMNKMLCTLGKFDIPIIQMQPPFVVDLLDSNIMLFGASMSGKTTFIRTLVNILHKRYSEKEEQVFILDFGGGLSEYKSFPLVAAYFDNSNEEYVKRVFKIMENILKENVRILNGKNFRDAAEQPIHTTFVIDNINAFIDEPRYSAYMDKLAKLCRDGLSKGITIVVTAVETKGLASYMGSFKQKIAFEMPPDKYGDIFNGKVDQVGNNPGHGFANVTVRPAGVTGNFRMNLPYEVQCLLPYAPQSAALANTENGFITKLREKFAYSGGEFVRSVKKYLTFPKELSTAEFMNLRQEPPAKEKAPKLPVDVALDYVDFYPVTVDMEYSPVVAIYGKKEFGKTNLLKVILRQIAEKRPNARMVFFDDGRNQLKDICDSYEGSFDCKYINGFSEETIHLDAVGSRSGAGHQPGKVDSAARPNFPARPAPMERPAFLNQSASFAKPEAASKVVPPVTNDSPPAVQESQESRTKKLSPLQRFYLYLNENYIDIALSQIANMFGISDIDMKRIPVKKTYEDTPFTVFVIQSKLVYLNTPESKYFIEKVLPRMAAVAEEKGYIFIFSDVQKVSEIESNTVFNSVLGTAFLLDNIAEFASERGQKTVFGSMDVKMLKEDYARCEKGDGYFYDIEADQLLKAKFIKFEEA